MMSELTQKPRLEVFPDWERTLVEQVRAARTSPAVDYVQQDCLRQAQRIVFACSGFDILMGRSYANAAELAHICGEDPLGTLCELWADFEAICPRACGRLDLAAYVAPSGQVCLGVGVGGARVVFVRDEGGCRLLPSSLCTHAWRIPRHA